MERGTHGVVEVVLLRALLLVALQSARGQTRSSSKRRTGRRGRKPPGLRDAPAASAVLRAGQPERREGDAPRRCRTWWAPVCSARAGLKVSLASCRRASTTPRGRAKGGPVPHLDVLHDDPVDRLLVLLVDAGSLVELGPASEEERGQGRQASSATPSARRARATYLSLSSCPVLATM